MHAAAGLHCRVPGVHHPGALQPAKGGVLFLVVVPVHVSSAPAIDHKRAMLPRRAPSGGSDCAGSAAACPAQRSAPYALLSSRCAAPAHHTPVQSQRSSNRPGLLTAPWATPCPPAVTPLPTIDCVSLQFSASPVAEFSLPYPGLATLLRHSMLLLPPSGCAAACISQLLLRLFAAWCLRRALRPAAPAVQWYEFIGWYWHVAVRSLVGLATSLLLGLLGGGGDSAGREWELAQRIAFFAAAGQVLGAAGERQYYGVLGG